MSDWLVQQRHMRNNSPQFRRVTWTREHGEMRIPNLIETNGIFANLYPLNAHISFENKWKDGSFRDEITDLIEHCTRAVEIRKIRENMN